MVALIYMFSDRVPLAVLLGWAVRLVARSWSRSSPTTGSPALATLADLRGHWRWLMALSWLSALGGDLSYLATAAEDGRRARGHRHHPALQRGPASATGTALSVARVHIALLGADRGRHHDPGGQQRPLLRLRCSCSRCYSVQAQNGQIIAAARAEISRREAAGTVRMLLYDYEEHSSDWLWTIDPAGKLRDVSRRFAEAAGKAVHELEGMALLDVSADRRGPRPASGICSNTGSAIS